jgi:hypothetical protein
MYSALAVGDYPTRMYAPMIILWHTTGRVLAEHSLEVYRWYPTKNRLSGG